MATTSKNEPVRTMDQYIAGFPKPIQVVLGKLRNTIRKAAPGAEETISYAIPTFTLEGNLVHFAAFQNHIGFYPAPSGIKAFSKELSAYEGAKGSIKFPNGKPIPLNLVTRIVKFRVKENLAKSKDKWVKNKSKPVKSKKPSDDEQVTAWLNKLDPQVKSEIQGVRKIIKDASTKLNERIKWNAPSYYYQDDILTFGPYKQDKILLVFHHPGVVKIKSSLLEGDYKDRRLIYFRNKSAAAKNKKQLKRIINEIIKLIDNK